MAADNMARVAVPVVVQADLLRRGGRGWTRGGHTAAVSNVVVVVVVVAGHAGIPADGLVPAQGGVVGLHCRSFRNNLRCCRGRRCQRVGGGVDRGAGSGGQPAGRVGKRRRGQVVGGAGVGGGLEEAAGKA